MERPWKWSLLHPLWADRRSILMRLPKGFSLDIELRGSKGLSHISFLNEGDVFSVSKIDVIENHVKVVLSQIENAHIKHSQRDIVNPYYVCFKDYDGNKGRVVVNARNERSAKLQFMQHGYDGRITSIWRKPKWNTGEYKKI
jgi:ribosomal protein S17E